MPNFIECPSCRRKLRVPDDLADRRVKCPSCFTEFGAADAPSAAAPESSPVVPSETVPVSTPIFRDEPPFREPPVPHEEAPYREDRPYREEDDYAPDRRIPRGPRRDAESHRGDMILTLGIISVVLGGLSVNCCFFMAVFCVPSLLLGIPAVVMARTDLRKMAVEEMDPNGRSSTLSGYNCGLIGSCISGVVLFLWACIFMLMLLNQH